MTYSFTDRATYLVASTMWKADFTEHVKGTRKLKIDFKTAQRENSYSMVERLRSELSARAEKSRSMISERHWMKEEAQNQYLAAKQPS